MSDNLSKRLEQIITLNNSDEFKQLDQYYNKKSYFSILRIARSEVHHDNFLLWLFTPSECHELGDFALKRLLELLVLVKNKLQVSNNELQFPDNIEDNIVCGNYTLENILCDRQHVTDKRRFLDLFISFDFINNDEPEKERKINIIIENKVGAKEGPNQTNDYYTYGENLEGETIYLYLSPIPNSEYEELTDPSCECKHYIGLNYQYLADYVIEQCLSECTTINSKVFIEEYLRALSQPSLQDENNGGEIIMAVSTREKELLRNFWKSNKDLLTAALNALADDPELEPECRDKINEIVPILNSASNRDFSKYSFEGAIYPKNRLVLAVIQKYVADNQNITIKELKQVFSDPKLKLEILVPLSNARDIIERTGKRRHFAKEGEFINLSDGEFAVSTEWTSELFNIFVEIAERLGYIIDLSKGG